MNSNQTFSAARLRAKYKESPLAKTALDYFASRSNNSSVTKVDRFQEVLTKLDSSTNRRDVVEFLKFLETINCGEFVVGRRKSPSRFKWSVGLVSVGLAASGEVDVVDKLTPSEIARVDDDDDEVLMTHSFQLRRSLKIALCLPPDLTTSEAMRIAEFVKALPFESEGQG